MKKITLLLTALIFACALANAQPAQYPTSTQPTRVSTKWETDFNRNLQKNRVYNTYLGQDENSYFLLTNILARDIIVIGIGVKYGVVKYDKRTLRPTGSTTLDNLGEIKEVYVVGNETYARIQNPVQYFRRTKIYEFYKFNKNSMTFEAVTHLGAASETFSDVVVSPDNSKMLLVFREPAARRESNDNYRLLLIDSQLQKIWEQSISVPTVSSFAAANDGTVYAAFKNSHSNKRNDTSYEYVILKLSGENEERRFVVDMNNYLYHECQLITNHNSNLFVVGFYTDRADEDKTGGYYFSLNEDFDTAENIAYQEIPLNILNAHYGKAKKVPYRYTYFEFGQPLYAQNGDVVICSEENTRRTQTTFTQETSAFEQMREQQTGRPARTTTTSSTSTRSHFLDIYVFRISNNELAWMKRVPKRQTAVDRDKVKNAPMLGDRLGYSALLSGNDVVLLFSDNIKRNMGNNENTEKVAFAMGKDCALVSVILDQNGAQRKQIVPVSGLTRDKLDPEIQKAFVVSDNQILVSARRKTKCKMGVITVTP